MNKHNSLDALAHPSDRQTLAALWATSALVPVDNVSGVNIAQLAARVRKSVHPSTIYEQDCAHLVNAIRTAMKALDPFKAQALAIYMRLDLLIEDARLDDEALREAYDALYGDAEKAFKTLAKYQILGIPRSA